MAKTRYYYDRYSDSMVGYKPTPNDTKYYSGVNGKYMGTGQEGRVALKKHYEEVEKKRLEEKSKMNKLRNR